MRQTGAVPRADPVERILNLLTLLHESPGPMTRAEIVAGMARGSTPYPTDPAALHQMFSSDRRTLTAGLGVVIHQRVRSGHDAGQTEYWVDSAEIRLPDLGLEDDERLVLALALAIVSRTVPHAAEAEMKLGTGWVGPTTIDISVEVPSPVVALIQAARSESVVDVDQPAIATAVALEPWAVVLSDGAWTCIGAGHDDGRTVVVRIGAATDVTVRDGLRATHRRLPLDEAMIDELLAGRAVDIGTARVVVDRSAAIRALLSDRIIDRTETDDGVELEVAVDDLVRFRQWVLSLGDRAVVDSPPEIRRHVADWLDAIVDTPSGIDAVPPRPSNSTRRPGPEPVTQRLHRLLAIVPWLYRQRSVRVAEIAQRVGASAEQIVRDLTLASMCGVPPYTADSLYGFWVETETDGEPVVHVLHPNLLVDAVRLTPRQAASVSVALSALMALPGTDTDVVGRLRDKVDGALGGAEVRVRLDEPPYLDLIRRASDAGHRLCIQYVDLDDDLTERIIDPHLVFVDRGHSYVYTDDHMRQGERVFRVDRIVSAEPTGDVFARREITVSAGRNWQWMIPDQEVVVGLPPGCEWVMDRYATRAHLVRDDGSIVVWLSVVSHTWLMSLLIRCGPGAVILDPVGLHDEFIERARRLSDRYRD